MVSDCGFILNRDLYVGFRCAHQENVNRTAGGVFLNNLAMPALGRIEAAEVFNRCFRDIDGTVRSPHISIHSSDYNPVIQIQYPDDQGNKATARMYSELSRERCPRHPHNQYRRFSLFHPMGGNSQFSMGIIHGLLIRIDWWIWNWACRSCQAPPQLPPPPAQPAPSPFKIGGGPSDPEQLRVEHSSLVTLLGRETDYRPDRDYQWVRLLVDDVTIDALHLEGKYYELHTLEPVRGEIARSQKVDFYDASTNEIKELSHTLLLDGIDQLDRSLIAGHRGVVELIADWGHYRVPFHSLPKFHIGPGFQHILVHFFR
jgi:hypothetical protein